MEAWYEDYGSSYNSDGDDIYGDYEEVENLPSNNTAPLTVKIRTVATLSFWDLEDRNSYHEIIPQEDGGYKLRETFESHDPSPNDIKLLMEHMTEQDELDFKRAIVYLSDEEGRRFDITSSAYEEQREKLEKTHWSYIAEASGKFLIGFENKLFLLNDDGSVPDHAKYSPEDLERARKRQAESEFQFADKLAVQQHNKLPAIQYEFRQSSLLDWVKSIWINRKRNKLLQKIENGHFDHQPFQKLHFELGSKYDAEIFQNDLISQIFTKGIIENQEDPKPAKYSLVFTNVRSFKNLISENTFAQEKFRDFVNEYLIKNTRSSSSLHDNVAGLIRQMDETNFLQSCIKENTKLQIAAILIARDGSFGLGGTTLKFLSSLSYPDNFRDLIIEEAPEYSNANGVEIALRNYKEAMKDIESADEREGAHQLSDSHLTIFQIPNSECEPEKNPQLENKNSENGADPHSNNSRKKSNPIKLGQGKVFRQPSLL